MYQVGDTVQVNIDLYRDWYLAQGQGRWWVFTNPTGQAVIEDIVNDKLRLRFEDIEDNGTVHWMWAALVPVEFVRPPRYTIIY